jgi:hypothetical protein
MRLFGRKGTFFSDKFLDQRRHDGFVNKAPNGGVADNGGWDLQGGFWATWASGSNDFPRRGFLAGRRSQEHTSPLRFDGRCALAGDDHKLLALRQAPDGLRKPGNAGQLHALNFDLSAAELDQFLGAC